MNVSKHIDRSDTLMEIVKATAEHVDEVSRLFDLYRQFYHCPPDLDLATQFIAERIERQESDVFVAIEGSRASGFTQLYPTFCSVEAIKRYVLYDIYVDEDRRGTGLGEKLMNRATEWAKENGAARIDLLTAHDNMIGQSLYEKLGYKKVLQDFYAYSLDLT